MNSTVPNKTFSSLSVLVCVLLLGVLLSACSGQASPSTDSSVPRTTPLTAPPHPLANVPEDMSKLTGGRALAPNEVKPLAFNLVYDDAAMARDVASIYTLGSPSFHKFLSKDAIVQRYALSESQLQQVKDWLSQQGYSGISVDPLRSSIQVHGTIATIEHSLHIKMVAFTVFNRTVFAPQGDPTLPNSIAALVQSITGLNNLAFPNIRPPFSLQHSETLAGNDCAKYGAKQTLTRDKLAGAYQIDHFYQQQAQGQGMSVGIAEFSEPFDSADVNNYAACAGVAAPSIETVEVDGHVPAGSGEGEAAMDVELVAGLAPQAHILVYQGNTDTTSFAQGLLDVFNRVATDQRVQVLSVSYGTDENKFSTTEQAAINRSLERLAAEGIAVFISSGDCGAYSLRVQHVAIVSFPASAPYAISVGGTHLLVNENNQRTSETAWSVQDNAPVCQNEWGSGGGVSQNPDFHRPSWQVGPGTTNQYDGTQSAVLTATLPPLPVSAPNGLRQVPDVAAAAYPNIAIYYQGAWVAAGGTSAAAPIWAAGGVLVDQVLQRSGKGVIGSVPDLYTLANSSHSFHPYTDITSGDNLFYPATSGWDYATGWGSPNFDDLTRLALTQ